MENEVRTRFHISVSKKMKPKIKKEFSYNPYYAPNEIPYSTPIMKITQLPSSNQTYKELQECILYQVLHSVPNRRAQKFNYIKAPSNHKAHFYFAIQIKRFKPVIRNIRRVTISSVRDNQENLTIDLKDNKTNIDNMNSKNKTKCDRYMKFHEQGKRNLTNGIRSSSLNTIMSTYKSRVRALNRPLYSKKNINSSLHITSTKDHQAPVNRRFRESLTPGKRRKLRALAN